MNTTLAVLVLSLVILFAASGFGNEQDRPAGTEAGTEQPEDQAELRDRMPTDG